VTHQPFIKWYPTDWRADPRLRMCSLSARGLWIELIGYMHEGEPYGHLTINGISPAIEDVASLVGRPLGEVRKAWAELEQRQVFSREGGAIYSRRMVRDKAKAEKDRQNGKGGGNPKLRGEVKEGVNPQDKAHIPEARSQKEDAAPAAPDPEVELFRRGREVLGKQAGGLISKLLAAKQKNIPLARAAIEQASTKSDPREYIGAIIRGKQAADQPQWLDGIEGVI
jgi:hypothetical protein